MVDVNRCRVSCAFHQRLAAGFLQAMSISTLVSTRKVILANRSSSAARRRGVPLHPARQDGAAQPLGPFLGRNGRRSDRLLENGSMLGLDGTTVPFGALAQQADRLLTQSTNQELRHRQ